MGFGSKDLVTKARLLSPIRDKDLASSGVRSTKNGSLVLIVDIADMIASISSLVKEALIRFSVMVLG